MPAHKGSIPWNKGISMPKKFIEKMRNGLQGKVDKYRARFMKKEN